MMLDQTRIGLCALGAALLLVSVLPGCLDRGMSKVALPPVTGHTTYEYLCPDGKEWSLACPSLSEPGSTLLEPTVAADPTRTGVFAVAAIETSPTGPQENVSSARLVVFVTTDGGVTWTRHPVPYPENPWSRQGVAASIDPSIAFDSHGVLHVSGLLGFWDAESTETVLGNAVPLPPASNTIFSQEAHRNMIYYVTSDDLGKTWSPPQALTDVESRGNDRPWLTLVDDHVVVTWMKINASGFSTSVAWLPDRNQTWIVHDPAEDLLGCSFTQPVLRDGNRLLLACSKEHPGIFVYELDPPTGHATLLGKADVNCYSAYLLKQADGDLLILCRFGEASRSRDGGRQWSSQPNLVKLVGRENWSPDSNVWVHWIIVDSQGNLQVLFSGKKQQESQYLSRTVIHAVFETTNWTIIKKQQLTPASEGLPPTRIPPSYRLVFGDDFYGIASQDEKEMIVWTREGGIDVAEVKSSFQEQK